MASYSIEYFLWSQKAIKTSDESKNESQIMLCALSGQLLNDEEQKSAYAVIVFNTEKELPLRIINLNQSLKTLIRDRVGG